MCTHPSFANPVPSNLRHKLFSNALTLFPTQERGGVLFCIHFLGSESGTKGTRERSPVHRRPNLSDLGKPLFWHVGTILCSCTKVFP